MHAWLFTREMGVDVALNQADLMARMIEEEMSLGDMMTLLRLHRGRFSLVEEKLPAGAPAVGVAIKDLPLPGNSVIAAVIRHHEVVSPRGDTVLEVGDEVLAICEPLSVEALATLFSR